jgi:protein-L-isoaspartate(D-aspartate) O-methyltransferase
VNWVEQRERMVERQIRRRGVKDRKVLAAMRAVPREEFVPDEFRSHAYDDDPLPIGLAQTISQPYMVALMAESLLLSGDECVLEVGCGSGYAAAVLGMLAGEVVTIELLPELAARASETLKRTGYSRNVLVVCGDGSMGYAAKAPYRAITVAAGAPDVPPALLAQLDEGGRLVIPVGPHEDQELRVVSRKNGKIECVVATRCRFVPLTGEQGWK